MKRSVLFFLLVCLCGGAVADDALLLYRVRVMEAAHRHLQAIDTIVNKGVALRSHAGSHARALEEFADMIPELFPPGRNAPGSEALPAIWQRWDEFGARARETAKRAAALASIADTADNEVLQDAYYDLLESCKACHRDFRE